MKTLRDEVVEAVKIAEGCADNLQQICFEVILKHVLALRLKHSTPLTNSEKNEQKKKTEVPPPHPSQDDLKDSDLDLKARKFLKHHGLTLSDVNQLFYKENGNICPLYDDLKTTQTSESQVRITLLQCLQSAIKTGNFHTSMEGAREEAKTRKCYDSSNWGNNFTNNAALFDFQKYSSALKGIKLSTEGKKKLAELVKELR